MSESESPVKHYDTHYSQFTSDLYAEIRSISFGEDIGQNGWLTREEHDRFVSWLSLTPDARLLDVACGSGRPTLRIARLTSCIVQGIDVNESAVAAARASAVEQQMVDRAAFDKVDAAKTLPFDDATFKGLICIDAVNHLPNRLSIIREWARVLRPGGQLVFTDPVVVTGPLTNQEIAVRSSIGFFLFVIDGFNENVLADAGFEIVKKTDATENMALLASRWYAAREDRSDALRRVEGEETSRGQQELFAVAAQLAAERRLSRFVYHAVHQ